MQMSSICFSVMRIVRSVVFFILFVPVLHAQNNPAFYRLRVVDSVEQKPVAFATAVLLDDANLILAGSLSTEDGLVQIDAGGNPTKLRLSCVGYVTREFPVNGSLVWGDVGLLREAKQIDDVTVAGNLTNYDLFRTSHTVTEAMRQQAQNVEQLVGQLPGVRFDKITNAIKVDNQIKVLLLADHVQRNESYIRSLSPDRIQSIEVMKHPTGRFLSDDYYAVVNFVLKPDYVGYSLNVRSLTIVNPVGTNGSAIIANQQPGVGIGYTNQLVDFQLSYGYAIINWYHPLSIIKDYRNHYLLESEVVTEDDPNQNYHYLADGANVGVTFKLSKNHSLTFEGDYAFERTDESTMFKMVRRFASGTAFDNFTDSTNERMREKKYSSKINYSALLGENWNVKADFAYDRYDNRRTHTYSLDKELFSSDFDIRRDFFKYGLDVDYSISSKLALNFGQSYVSRDYHTRLLTNGGSWDSEESRSRLYAELSYRPTPKSGFALGGAWHHSAMKNGIDKVCHSVFQPNARFNYNPSANFNINGRYATTSVFPTLYELGNMPVVVDPLMISSGNPELKPAYLHQASVDFSFWQTITITPQYQYAYNHITPYFGYSDAGYFHTYRNVKSNDFSVLFNLNLPISDFLEFDGNIAYHYQKMRYSGQSNRYHTWLGTAALSYFNPEMALGADLEYDRSMDKMAVIQGYEMTGMDIWQLSAYKKFFKKQAQIMVSYVLPLSWGTRVTQKSVVETPYYREAESFGLKTYHNMLFIRLNLYLNRGKRSSPKPTTTIDEDNKQSRNIIGQ